MRRATAGAALRAPLLAAGVGVCLAAERGVFTAYSALTFGPDLKIRRSVSLQGVPSRVRVSSDGRRAAITLFVVGDSYNSTGFSTRTTILDVASGGSIADLEAFAVTRAGARFKARDFNFWGVTFARDGNRFFATLRSGTTNYLVEGDVDARTARSCGRSSAHRSRPTTRGWSSRSGSAPEWRLHVLIRDAARSGARRDAERGRPGRSGSTTSRSLLALAAATGQPATSGRSRSRARLRLGCWCAGRTRRSRCTPAAPGSGVRQFSA